MKYIPKQQQQPMMRNGSRGSVAANEAMVGARSPPILAEVEHKPIAEFLKNDPNKGYLYQNFLWLNIKSNKIKLFCMYRFIIG